MKKLHLLLLSITLCVFSACHNDIWDAIDGLDSRVTKLEELCKEMNTNITSLQTIVSVLQSNDFITGIVEIKKNGEVIGYTITFGKHDPITIYHGQDGKDGADGKDGQDGQNGSANAPVIGVAQDTDGVYYWTLNGEWLLDDNGNKLPVSGKDGQNGANGTMPQLKIEEGYWYVSYDNGVTWTQLGKAIGEDGEKGEQGESGDSMFQTVTQDANYVYFTLADGTVIKIAKSNGSNDQPNSEFIFTITYDPNGGEGVMVPDTFYYGISKVVTLTCFYTRDNHYFTEWNTRPDGSGVTYAYGTKISIDKNIILYAQWEKALGTPSEYVDLGLSVKWATYNVGATTPEEYGDYFAWGEVKSKIDYTENNYKYYDNYYGYTKYNPTDKKEVLDIIDDAARINWGGGWRIPSSAEWWELLSNCAWKWNEENNGYVVTSQKEGYTDKSIFIPRAGYKGGGNYSCGSHVGHYWANYLGGRISSYDTGERFAGCICILDGVNGPRGHSEYRYSGLTIRPVCP